MKRMLFLSVAFHALLFLGLILPSFLWSKRQVTPVVHRVELVSLPQAPARQSRTVPARKLEPKPVEKKPVRQKPKPKIEKAKKPKPVEERPKVAKKAPPPPEVQRAVEEDFPKAETEQEMSSVEVAKKQDLTAPELKIPDVRPVLKKQYTEYEFYHSLIAMKIKRRWSPPPTSMSDGQMEAVVAFSLSRSGRIRGNVRLVKSSGNPFYDQAALRATLGTLPPPPPGYPEELLEMKLVYVLDSGGLR